MLWRMIDLVKKNVYLKKESMSKTNTVHVIPNVKAELAPLDGAMTIVNHCFAFMKHSLSCLNAKAKQGLCSEGLVNILYRNTPPQKPDLRKHVTN